MYSKRKQKRRYIRRWEYLPIEPTSVYDVERRGGVYRKRRLCTAYLDEEQNWLYSSYSYFLEVESYWQERWTEYYSGCL